MERRLALKEQLLPVIKIKIDRDKIVENVIAHYRQNLNLEHHLIEVEMDKGQAADVDGVTKEMFHIFFTRIVMTHFEGAVEMIPNDDHRYIYFKVVFDQLLMYPHYK